MLTSLRHWSQNRSSWILLALTAIGLEATALYFQYGMELMPCVMCIYQRIAVLGILVAALIGATAPKMALMRIVGGFLWLYSAYRGIELSWEHTQLIINPSPFATCDFFVTLPSWFPLHEWFPSVFQATGDCSISQWKFLSLEMPQWMLIIFSAYFIVGLLVLISQVTSGKRK
ncbi:disulfide bond formation protein DsbB [Proteus myxofaciens]|uniref:Disulfide bond formation protein B n=1 Tax=Proteus myxofaciens ATCC 19692 TaxID=1354337 RepID=A0A198GKX7_9GAMM|nr:disulfide bond formation protein DsbB [Proteus myxofaciens]OAT37555.1 periplasmic thiol:disulfide oxidoreductase [Proteus myxofaciens ATCC 19692]